MSSFKRQGGSTITSDIHLTRGDNFHVNDKSHLDLEEKILEQALTIKNL